MKVLRLDGRLPGFGLSLGYTIIYLTVIVILPLLSLFLIPADMSLADIGNVLSNLRVQKALWLSLWTSLLAALINTIIGVITAWVIVRYKFFGRKLINLLIDLPFALPTAVAGIALTTLFGPHGLLGAPLESIGIHVTNSPLGIILAMIFIGFPFVVRTVQPVIEELPAEAEEASASLGATRLKTFWKVIFPELLPSMLAGFSLCFARGIGEYGSVIFISGNLPYKTEIAPLLIMNKLDQFDYKGAAVIAIVMLLISFSIVLSINIVQSRKKRTKS